MTNLRACLYRLRSPILFVAIAAGSLPACDKDDAGPSEQSETSETMVDTGSSEAPACEIETCLTNPDGIDCLSRCEDDPSVDGCWSKCEPGESTDCWSCDCGEVYCDLPVEPGECIDRCEEDPDVDGCWWHCEEADEVDCWGACNL